MKLWKSKKTSTTSCVPSGKTNNITTCKSTQQQNEDKIETSAISLTTPGKTKIQKITIFILFIFLFFF
jgi:hypothetical protein